MEVIAFNTSDFKLTEFIGSKILHIYPISSSVGHDINMLKYDIKHAKEAYSNERGTENIDFEDMLSKLVMYRYMTLQIPIILGFDNGRSVIIDLTIDSKDPCSISDTTELPEKYRLHMGNLNVDSDKLLSPVTGKTICDIEIRRDKYGHPIFDFITDDARLCIWHGKFYMTAQCFDVNEKPLTLLYPELKSYLKIDNEGAQMLDAQVSYEEVGWFSEDMCSVATVAFELGDLAYHSDHIDRAGIRGYINKYGEEVIKNQYIYAFEFEDGIAIFAKGRWIKEREDENGKPLYWPEDEHWGGIDYTGNEVIPFIFDEIEPCFDTMDYFIAHVGGWPDGSWGVIDRTGKWVAEPQFEQLDNDWNDGLLVFGYYNTEINDDLYGLYDTTSNKIILEPVNSDIWFNDDGTVEIGSYDKDPDKRTTKILSIDDLRSVNI